METELSLSAPLEFMLAHAPVGLAVLDATTLRIYYANPYFLSLLDESWRSQRAAGQFLRDLLPTIAFTPIEEQLREASANRKALHFNDIPYEGFLETRGRTYWNVSIEPDLRGLLPSLFANQLPVEPGKPAQLSADHP